MEIEEYKKILEDYLASIVVNTESKESSFVIPYTSINDGVTPAQIRYSSKGLYKDIQRSPFIRKSGVFNDSSKIEDIDITSLVRYGTLEQAKIAPTLENVDIKLYFREPKLKKIQGTENDFADEYIWREIPVGFHVYNNDTIYGYEWVVLQDDYVNTDGIYNLHMNIEDGLGVCKFAGTQAPISLKGVQYKIIITAKNLWSREYSLLETDSTAIKDLYTSSDSLSPTVNAVRDFYKEALYTLSALTPVIRIGPDNEVSEESFRQEENWYENFSFGFVADKDGASVKKLSLGAIEDLEQQINEMIETQNNHQNHLVDNPALDEDKNMLGVHGILNTGAKGNIDAKSIAGVGLSNGAQALTENLDKYAFIPYVSKDDEIGVGTSLKYYTRAGGKSPELLYSTLIQRDNVNKSLSIQKEVRSDELSSIVEKITVGGTSSSIKFFKNETNEPTYKILGVNGRENANLEINKVTVSTIDLGASEFPLNRINWMSVNSASSIAYKNPISEKIDINWEDYNQGELRFLYPNTDRDADGNKVNVLNSSEWNSKELLVPENLDDYISKKDVSTFVKLGSALQALYELPLGTYVYKRGQEEYKEQLGIFVERVNQIRDNLVKLTGSSFDEDGNPALDNILVHKKNSYVKSIHPKVKDADKGIDASSLVNLNTYSYTDEELKSIYHYLNLFTSKKELSQELRNTVGVLLNAAKETQERLLDLETSIYGWDSPTVPGNTKERREAFLDKHIDKELQDQLTNAPLLLGINRVLRSLCLEVFDTAELEKIESEMESRVGDSDDGSKVSIKSRMDKIDEISSNIFNQISGVIEFLNNSKRSESAQSYTDLVYDNTGLNVESERHFYESIEKENEIEERLLSSVKEDHDSNQNVSDVGGQWKSLASKEEIDAKEEIGFANISPNVEKHSPSKFEVGTVRVPEVLTTELICYANYFSPEGSICSCVISEDEYNKFLNEEITKITIDGRELKIKNVDQTLATVSTDFNKLSHVDVTEFTANGEKTEIPRTWNLLNIEKNRAKYTDDFASNGSYKPFYKTKAVAWEKAKLQRLNKKVSELTKTLYGVDDVVAKYPNRMETLRRNISNVIDDLYPNRSFSIEASAPVSNSIVVPFKNSKTTNVLDGATFAELNTDEENIFQSNHTSIIEHFDNEIFNFELKNNYIGNNPNDSASKNCQYSTTDDVLKFDSSNLITDYVSNIEGYGTYKKAFSKLDLLEKAIGLQNIYFGDLLYNSNITLLNGKDYSRYVNELAVFGSDAAESALIVREAREIKNESEAIYNAKIAEKEYCEEEKKSNENRLANINKRLTSIDLEIENVKKEKSDIERVNNEAKKASDTSNILKENIQRDIAGIDESISRIDFNGLNSSIYALNAEEQRLNSTLVENTEILNTNQLIANAYKDLKTLIVNSIDYVNKVYTEIFNFVESYQVYLNFDDLKNRLESFGNGELIDKYGPSQDSFTDGKDNWSVTTCYHYLGNLCNGFDVGKNFLSYDSSISYQKKRITETRKIVYCSDLENRREYNTYPGKNEKVLVFYFRNGETFFGENETKDIDSNGNVYIASYGDDRIEYAYARDLPITKTYFYSKGNYHFSFSVLLNFDLTTKSLTFKGFNSGVSSGSSWRSTGPIFTFSLPNSKYQQTSDYVDSVFKEPFLIHILESQSVSVARSNIGIKERLTEITKERGAIEKEKGNLVEEKNALLNKKAEKQKELSAVKSSILEINDLKSLDLCNYKLQNLNNEKGTLNSEKELSLERINELDTMIASLGNDSTGEISVLKQDLDAATLDYTEKLKNSSTKEYSGFPTYIDELLVKDPLTKKALVTTESEIASNSNLGFVFSRKEKPISNRITTVESYLDGVAKAANYWSILENNNTSAKKPEKSNTRYETSKTSKNLSDALDYVNTLRYKKVAMVFDLDLSNSFEDCLSHNASLFQILEFSENVKKSDFSLETSSGLPGYSITGTFSGFPDILPLDLPQGFNLKKGVDFTINVTYVDSKPVVLGRNTIYLCDRSFIGENSMFTNTAAAGFGTIFKSERGFENQTEYNIYNAMRKLFTSVLGNEKTDLSTLTAEEKKNNLFYQLSLKEHPVGEVYCEVRINNNTSVQTPAQRWGGVWQELDGGYLLASKDNISTVDGSVISPLTSSLEVSQIPLHNHSGVVYSHWHTVGNAFLKASNMSKSGAFEMPANYSGSGRVMEYANSVETSTSQSSFSIGNTGTSGAKLVKENIPHFNVKMWVRIS